MASVFSGFLFADYHQFYLADPESPADYAEEVTEEAMTGRVLSKDGALVVFTARNMTVPGEVELHQSEPDLPLGDADHVVVAGLRSSGTIAIAGCTDHLPAAARFAAPPGSLRAAVVFTGLGSLSADGLEGNDRYTVHLWPGASEGIRILKQWEEP